MLNKCETMKVKQTKCKWLFPLFLVAFLMATAVNTEAQIKVGATAGTNFNSFSQPGTTIGANVGGFGRYQILDFLEAQAEIKYSLTGGGRYDYTLDFSVPGSSPSSDNLITSIDYRNRGVLLHAVEVPISARVSLPDLTEATIEPKLILGFSYAYIFGAFEQRDGMFHFNDGSEILLSNLEENIGANIKSSNLSFFLGFAIDYNLDNGNTFTTEFRYQRGINNLNDVGFVDPDVTDTMYSQTVSINFSYQIFTF